MRRRSSSLAVLVAVAATITLGLSAVGAASAAPSDGAHLVSGAPEFVREAVEFNDIMYLVGTSESEEGLGLWSYDGATFSEVPGVPADPYNLVVAEDAIYFYTSHDDGTSAIGSFNGTVFAEYAVESVSGITAVPGGGIAFAGGPGATYGLTFLKGGVFTQAVGGPNPISSIGFANGNLFVAGGGMDSRRVYRYADSVFTEVAGDYTYPGYVRGIGANLYFPATGGLFQVNPEGTSATFVEGSFSPIYSPVTEFQGHVYFTGPAPVAAIVLFEIVDGVAVAVEGAPNFSQSAEGVGDSLYIAANPEGMSIGKGPELFVYDGTTFSPVPSVARYPGGFFEFRGADYFIAQVEGRTSTLGSWPSLFRVGLEPTPVAAEPALAATGVDASAPLALAALLLLAGGAAVGIRRRTRAEV